MGNLEPRLRSPTNSIQLVSVVHTEFITKYGINTILEPFVRDVARLESVCSDKSTYIAMKIKMFMFNALGLGDLEVHTCRIYVLLHSKDFFNFLSSK